MFEKAIEILDNLGCEYRYSSSAVPDELKSLESVAHELAHASVARLPLVLEDDEKTYGISRRIGVHIGNMTNWAQDRNEEITLAIEIVMFRCLKLPISIRKLVKDADWKKVKKRSIHLERVGNYINKPTTERHAKHILRFLERLESGRPGLHKGRT